MNFLEALDFCKQTGKSITIARYTPESQATIQWYLDHDSILVCQNNNGAPKCNGIPASYWKDDWVEYAGPHVQYAKRYKEAKLRMTELENELGPILSKLDEYKKLKDDIEKYEKNR